MSVSNITKQDLPRLGNELVEYQTQLTKIQHRLYKLLSLKDLYNVFNEVVTVGLQVETVRESIKSSHISLVGAQKKGFDTTNKNIDVLIQQLKEQIMEAGSPNEQGKIESNLRLFGKYVDQLAEKTRAETGPISFGVKPKAIKKAKQEEIRILIRKANMLSEWLADKNSKEPFNAELGTKFDALHTEFEKIVNDYNSEMNATECLQCCSKLSDICTQCNKLLNPNSRTKPADIENDLNWIFTNLEFVRNRFLKAVRAQKVVAEGVFEGFFETEYTKIEAVITAIKNNRGIGEVRAEILFRLPRQFMEATDSQRINELVEEVDGCPRMLPENREYFQRAEQAARKRILQQGFMEATDSQRINDLVAEVDGCPWMSAENIEYFQRAEQAARKRVFAATFHLWAAAASAAIPATPTAAAPVVAAATPAGPANVTWYQGLLGWFSTGFLRT